MRLPSVSQTDDRGRLRSVWDQYSNPVYAYALRHCGYADAGDVRAETFAAAWQRRDQVQTEPLLLLRRAELLTGMEYERFAVLRTPV